MTIQQFQGRLSELTALQNMLYNLGIQYKLKEFPKDFARTIVIKAPSPLVDGEGWIEIDFDTQDKFIGINIKK